MLCFNTNNPTGHKSIVLTSGRIVKFWGAPFTCPISNTVEISELSSPVVTADELDELAHHFLELAAYLRGLDMEVMDDRICVKGV